MFRNLSLTARLSLLFFMFTLVNVVLFWLAVGSNQMRLLADKASLQMHRTIVGIEQKLQIATAANPLRRRAEFYRTPAAETLLAGPQFLIYEWKEPQVIFTGSTLAGAANAALTGYTFSADYTVFSAMGILRAERSFGPVTVGLQLVLNYLFDQSLNFSSSGLGLGVQYATGRH